ncbi:MAG: CAP domain-containing protein, partial [Pseudolabrys sp.]
MAGHWTRFAALAGALMLAACAGQETPVPSEPSFYQSMARPGAVLDTAAAASMVSGYRQNNGLDPVTIDPELTRLAQEQAQAMAKRDKL